MFERIWSLTTPTKFHANITPSHCKASCINLVGYIFVTYFKGVTIGAGTA